jgi:hypothetical protein
VRELATTVYFRRATARLASKTIFIFSETLQLLDTAPESSRKIASITPFQIWNPPFYFAFYPHETQLISIDSRQGENMNARVRVPPILDAGALQECQRRQA